MPESQKPVKIILVTGYLGAGKTTLLNYVLSNDRDMRAAVIVNDIGEVNIDEALIRDGGLSQADSVIPLTNGCICCSLSEDLAEQLGGIADTGDFDYIVIEASGICEPMPIAYTIAEFCARRAADGEAPIVLDNIVAVVDCARMIDEFDGGERLLSQDLEEDDVESLLVEQIEFCSTIVLNKTDLITPEQLGEVHAIVRSLQRSAVMLEAERGIVPLEELLDTGRFDFDTVYESAAWLDLMMHAGADEKAHAEGDSEHEHGCDHDHDGEHEHGRDHAEEHEHHGEHHHGHNHDDDDHEHGHAHHHHHHHHHGEDGDEGLEYGFSSFVYERRRPLDLDKFANFAANWPDAVIRTKGMVWVNEQPDICYLLEQAGSQRCFIENGSFVAALPADEQAQVLAENPGVAARWDDVCGDRLILLVFIGRNMDREAIEASLDACLTDWVPA